jgi:hypothetical protein
MTHPSHAERRPGSNEAPRGGSPAKSWLRRHRVKLVASLLIGAAFVWLLHAGALPLVPDASAFGAVRWWTVPGYIAVWIVVHLIRAGRWYWLLAPVQRVPLRTILPVAFIGFAAIFMLPFRTGEAVRPVLMHRTGKVSGWAATGTVAAERVIDGLCLSLLLFISLQMATPLDPLPDRIGELPVPTAVVPGAVYGALLMFAGAFVVMGLFYWRRRWARKVTLEVVGVVSPTLACWLAERVETVADGLRFLPQWRYALPFTLATLAYWMTNFGSAWLLARGCGFDGISYTQATVVLGVVALGILLPGAPGFFGAFQMGAYAGFAMYFPAGDVIGAGAAFVFMAYVCQAAITLVAGAISAAFGRTNWREGLATQPDELASAESPAKKLSVDHPVS